MQGWKEGERRIQTREDCSIRDELRALDRLHGVQIKPIRE